MVEKENFDKASVVFINNPHANIDHMFSCERRLESNAAICSRRDGKENVNINKSFAVSRDSLIL